LYQTINLYGTAHAQVKTKRFGLSAAIPHEIARKNSGEIPHEIAR
jgi:hypothetical protein